ncbi:MAG TPA: lysophospholipid acyltransferase family protein [Fimbriimonadaceae bacterium]|nr:lysophospholipid acyltransferase family protein [Fimbriimonadaceae bacterium]HRJ33846.1 lysophospholipid acyltransferase family protein [Fimbriimonadaceae bacterium]
MAKSEPLRHSLFFRLLYPAIYLVAALVMTVLGPFRVRGRRHVPRRGGVLILSNHLADIDPVAVHLASPRLVHFMAKKELFEMRILGSVIRFFKAFPVQRGAPDRAALRRAIELLQAGEVVCIFPEGQLSESGDLLPILPGAALVAKRAGVPIVCCGLRNTQRIMPYGQFIPRPAFRWVTAEFSPPLVLGPDAEVEEIAEQVAQTLARMTGQARRAESPPLE